MTGGFIHQTAVDAYEAQHCPPGRTMLLSSALLGLYLVFETGSSGAQVQRVHMVLARRRHPVAQIEPLQVADAGSAGVALQQVPRIGARAAVMQWAGQVWNGYGPLHDAIRSWPSTWPEEAWTAAHR